MGVLASSLKIISTHSKVELDWRSWHFRLEHIIWTNDEYVRSSCSQKSLLLHQSSPKNHFCPQNINQGKCTLTRRGIKEMHPLWPYLSHAILWQSCSISHLVSTQIVAHSWTGVGALLAPRVVHTTHPSIADADDATTTTTTTVIV